MRTCDGVTVNERQKRERERESEDDADVCVMCNLYMRRCMGGTLL